MDTVQKATKIAALVSELLNSIAVLFVAESRRPDLLAWRESTQERLREFIMLMGELNMRTPAGFDVERIRQEAEELLRLLSEWRAPTWPVPAPIADCGQRLLQEFGVPPEQIAALKNP